MGEEIQLWNRRRGKILWERKQVSVLTHTLFKLYDLLALVRKGLEADTPVAISILNTQILVSYTIPYSPLRNEKFWGEKADSRTVVRKLQGEPRTPLHGSKGMLKN